MEEILENLGRAVLEYDNVRAKHWARKAVEAKTDPIKAMDALTKVIRQVGDGFGKGELWLPELIGAAGAMMSAMPIIDEEIRRKALKRESLGTVVIGTVYGDIHTIGKTMVAILLNANGFIVHDLGTNVTSEQFLEAVRNYKPDILAMSALMTMTVPEQRKIIAALTEGGVRSKVKVMVGGAAVTQEFADEIGADGYDPTAPGAVELARTLVGK